MKLRVIACVGAFFCASVAPLSAFEISNLVSPFVTAAKFVGGLFPFGEEKKAERLEKAKEKAASESAASAPVEPDKVIGTVRFAYDNFVLIYTPIKLDLPAGTRVTTLGKDGLPRPVELSLSKERKGAFLVADVSSGEPLAGDIVVLLPSAGAAKVAEYQVLE